MAPQGERPATAATLSGAAPDHGIWTIPNLISGLRILGVPLFLYLILGLEADGWALAVLLISGGTDWLDGKLARWLNQMSRFGALLDPIADRLYMIAIPLAFAARGIIPWWLVAILLLREALLAATLPFYKSRGLGPPEVHYLGKAATFTLMIALPVMLAGFGDSAVATALHPWGWALMTWGVVLYVWTGFLYLAQAVRMARALPHLSRAARAEADTTPR
ncbi:CDP-alcohol phosphatidyltransferase family protein [Tomitella biformata]|uniref:CDP-alcohol phosphatidyltransferase family protein n=1 Tax=Tomitella biformata TaxID=630403 RepID=UPI0004658DFD|nr:CDP-alcohol phosphatidyltransferase family protein [Tomitella biformata]